MSDKIHFSVPEDRVPQTPTDQLADCGETFDGYTRDDNGNMIPTTSESRRKVKDAIESILEGGADRKEKSERTLNPMFTEITGKTVPEFIRDFAEIFELYKKAQSAERRQETTKPSTLELSMLITSLLTNDQFRDELKQNPTFVEYESAAENERRDTQRRRDERIAQELTRLRRGLRP